jgi:acetyl esterase/lipase
MNRFALRRSSMLGWLAVIAWAAFAAPLSARDPEIAPTFKDVNYGPHERNVLDFWQAKSEKPTPVVVYIHGGGFVAGDKSSVNAAMLKVCLDAGISCAAINYRYTTTAPFPGPMHDSARAIQFIRSKATEWNIDPKRIAAYGGSAGAGISMWLAFHDDLANPHSEDPVLRQSSRLTCAGSIGGQSTYDPLKIKELIGGRAWQHPALLPFYNL